MSLTTRQLKAINHKTGNLQLIACAGSGKTEVVARRVVKLIQSRGAKPRNIVAFTFTEKAAAELKERIHRRCQEELGEVHGMAEMYVGTIHAFCLDLLKTEAVKFLKFDLLNEVQQRLLIDRNCSKSGLTTSTDLQGNELKRYTDTPHYIAATSILREANTKKAVLAKCSVVKGLDAYRDLLAEKRYFDYSSILELAVQELKKDLGIRKRIRERIKHVIVDEYQDVNPIQESLIRQLHELGASVCVVGDDDQTLYQWRGSDVRNIQTFSTRYQNVTQLRLEENFRSSKGIVETARPFIEQNKEDRLSKKMQPTDAQDYEVGDIVALPFADPEEEAKYIADTMKSLRGAAIRENDRKRGISWSDMAILLRSVSANAQPITDALDTASIPYVIVGMNDLFGTAEAEAARQLFYFMADRDGVTTKDLEEEWFKAELGLSRVNIKKAIKICVLNKAAFDNPTNRHGFYSIQRVFLTFLEEAGVREDKIPNGRGEIVFYNLGKFSQVISDFEGIHFHSKPKDKYQAFAGFLQHQADEAYPEGWQNNQYANPDAVRVMTVHQAKGLQWPVVFVPALLKNRFPSPRMGGRNVWHLLPRDGVLNQERFEGTIEDERRLFYVAMTRSQKFLHLTWAPIPGKNNRYTQPSDFWNNVLASKFVKRLKPDYSGRERLVPEPKVSISNVVFAFSDIKYFFECPYQFKLRVLYGFNAPIHEALGYGRSLHNALAEVHARAIRGDRVKESDAEQLVDTHLHTPFSFPALKEKLEKAAQKVVENYIKDNKHLFDKIEFSEKLIDINLGDGVSIVGRIDLVRRKDTSETTIVDLKSNDLAQPEKVTETQLHIYALGYEKLTGRRADYVEIYELDERKRKPRTVDEDIIEDVKKNVRMAADALKRGDLLATPTASKCKSCDYRGMCSKAVHE